jgi:hypothetical protein
MIGRHVAPLAFSKGWHRNRFFYHASEHLKASLALSTHHALKKHKHQQSEDAVVPIIVKTPEEQT